jgi:DNA polymerase III epsilon subunit-like protein
MLINENKMWFKTIPEILNWLYSKSSMPWLFIDTETTGLGGPKKQQLTQISAIANNYIKDSNIFTEIGKFDQKIKLTEFIKNRYSNPGDTTRRILSFNHYGSGEYKYKQEHEVLNDFFDWMEYYTPALVVAQNASFDMSMICGRSGRKMTNEVLDTKILIQLYYIPLLQKLSETDLSYKNLINKIGTSDRDGGLISSSMSKIGPALDIDMNNYHDALTDCRITMEMYLKIVDFLEQHSDIDIMKYQVQRINIIKNN